MNEFIVVCAATLIMVVTLVLIDSHDKNGSLKMGILAFVYFDFVAWFAYPIFWAGVITSLLILIIILFCLEERSRNKEPGIIKSH